MSAGGKRIVLAVPSLANGGAERTASIWASELRHRGYDVTLLLFNRSASEYAVDAGVPIVALADSPESFAAMSLPELCRELRRALKRLQPDYVVSFLPPMQMLMLFAARGLGIRRIETLLNNPLRGKPHDNPFYRAIWRRCFHAAYRIVVQTKDQLRFFDERERAKCVVVPNPLSAAFAGAPARSHATAPTRFIAVGRLHPQKNHPLLVDAFAQVAERHPDIELRIYGKGGEVVTAQLQARIDAAGMRDRIALEGWTDRIEDAYRNADGFLLSSDYEGLPNALLEAMASELVCVATDCDTGPRDLVEDGVTGFLVPVGDEAAFAQAIERVLGMSADERARMASAARARVLECCSLERSVDALCACFD